MTYSMFPEQTPFTLGTQTYTIDQIFKGIGPHLLKARQAQLEQVAAKRCFEVVPILDNIHDEGNLNAVYRSAEAFGLYRVHVTHPPVRLKRANRVSMGADKWLDVCHWSKIEDALNAVKASGMQIIATDLSATTSLHEIDFTVPTAIVFGNEKDGISEITRQQADHRVVIPMYGFVESMNLSVAASITLYHIMNERRKAGIVPHRPPGLDQWLLAKYYIKSIKRAAQLLRCKREQGHI